jgi:hypothetical protein
MKKRTAIAALAATPLIGLPLAAMATPAHAAGNGTMYHSSFSPVPLNGQDSAGGSLMLSLHGNSAIITEDAHGLAAKFMGAAFPHVQHIHGGANGQCPTSSADTNSDGLITTTEGQPAYGPILTTLSVKGGTTPADGTNTKISPSGSSFHYSRTIQLDSKTVHAIKSGTAVIVVHGLDPATAPKVATTKKSELVPSLPQAATAPALCGRLVASQMSAVPTGGAATGGGSTSGLQDGGLLAGGLLGLALAGGSLAYRRRVSTDA